MNRRVNSWNTDTMAGAAKKGAPGFTAVFAIAGMLAVAYAMMRRRG
ncbi:MAG: PGF-CTERM sorting domain-containing protein [Euryarchaeota archaeon]|nr:PGF-CTERM sorting domain-containing protein [Euryarchaeota archaeon]